MKKLYPQTVNDLLLEIDQCERLVASIASVESAIAYRKSAGFLLVKSNLTNLTDVRGNVMHLLREKPATLARLILDKIKHSDPIGFTQPTLPASGGSTRTEKGRVIS